MKRDNFSPADGVDLGVLRFLTCGSVDDGKSTLIGRLLYDSKALLADTVATLEQQARKRGTAIDLSLLTDGLMAEREQGITIDVAYRYFATAQRKFIIADAPGHEQYTRNMVTAASTADVAVLLIDARKGVLPQTRRHATVATLLGVKQLIVAVNKMDLVEFDVSVFDHIVGEFRAWIAGHGNTALDVRYVPLCAVDGDNVADPSRRMSWYEGPTLLALLEQAPARQADPAAALRFPVQWVCRPAQGEPRGYAGRVEAGALAVGDALRVLPSGAQSRVTRIRLGEQDLQQAIAGQSVMLSLADEIDISRGDLLIAAGDETLVPRAGFSATLCWLDAAPLSPVRNYVIKHTTREAKARVTAVEAGLDIQSLAWKETAQVGLNDIARVRIKTQQPLAADAYALGRSTGSFILIDEATNATVAAGLIAADEGQAA